ncbi:c-type cytochrome [Croceibacterium ferulae]|uniref:c-type cytochrome n=1 Tax=Croceibacterium ferulae TaxID=1854641 RepID=UPI000EAE0914|nr:c-type cytochrome [Croceibacterium ferulae]
MKIAAPFLVLGLTIGVPGLAGCSSDERREERLQAAGAEPDLADLLRVAAAAVGEQKFGRCAACHTIAAGGPNLAGPNLAGVYGKGLAQGNPRFGYTAALLAAGKQGGRWDAATLDAWLADPQSVVPGTSMRFAGIADPLDRADIIAFLQDS